LIAPQIGGRQQANEFPHDPRNFEAAEQLESLGQEINDLGGQQSIGASMS